MTYNTIWVSALALYIAMRSVFKIRIDVWIGTILYGMFLIIRKLLVMFYNKAVIVWNTALGVRREAVIQRLRADTVSDFNSVYRMELAEVALTASNRPVKADLEKYHTLIAGASGAGKTVFLNQALAQLIGRGDKFFSEYELYILDLKSSRQDYLSLWAPVVTGYFGIDEDGSTKSAIAALESITEHMHRNEDKRIGIVIDELAMLTSQAPNPEMRKKGVAVLQRVSSQLRDRGFLVIATQRPHHQVIERNVTGNLERKICMRVDSVNTAKMILQRTPKTDATRLRNGEFILNEPGKRKEIVGRTMQMNLPDEIGRIVNAVLEARAEKDKRLRAFREACLGIEVGTNLPGINKIYKIIGITNKDMEAYYRNYALAGAITPNISQKSGKTTGYKLAQGYNTAFRNVSDYIREEKWKSNPEPFRRGKQ